MAFAQVVERQSPTVVILRTPVTQMIMFNQRMLITPGFKLFTYHKYWEYSICKHLELSLVRKGNKVINFNLKFISIYKLYTCVASVNSMEVSKSTFKLLHVLEM